MSKVKLPSKKSYYPKFPDVTWDRKHDLSHISLYGPEIHKSLYSHAIEVTFEGLGRLIIDIGRNGEILGIESLWASKHFPGWVLRQARILSENENTD